MQMYDYNGLDSSIASMTMTHQFDLANNDASNQWYNLVNVNLDTPAAFDECRSALPVTKKDQRHDVIDITIPTGPEISSISMTSAKAPVASKEPTPRRPIASLSSYRNKTEPVQPIAQNYKPVISPTAFKRPVGASILTDWWDDAIKPTGKRKEL